MSAEPPPINRDAVHRLLAEAYANYNIAFKAGDRTVAHWWDGAISRLHLVLESTEEE